MIFKVFFQKLKEKDGLLARFKDRRKKKYYTFFNKMPLWNENTKSYALNFHGRVTVSSVKNFQIVDNSSRKIF